MTPEILATGTAAAKEEHVREVLRDYWICCLSRECSLLARKEVLTGKAKFGIIGDGKEVPQVAMARAFRKGDWRSGYYRDQTLLFALSLQTVEQFFAQLYADPKRDPYSGGRQMNSHYATPNVHADGSWVATADQYNSSSDISSTGGQMARGLGLAFASSKYRTSEALQENIFSQNGEEVCFVTIGDASTSEGIFWETINAATVLQVPLAVSVWDDGYGISVPKKFQTAKESISQALSGFKSGGDSEGLDIYVVKGWDYPALCEVYEEGIARVRSTHTPALFHVEELTQPQGHSTSGSHERYKTKERLQWEQEHDCIRVMRQWILDSGIANEEELDALNKDAQHTAITGRDKAWKDFLADTRERVPTLLSVLEALANAYPNVSRINASIRELQKPGNLLWHELVKMARQCLIAVHPAIGSEVNALQHWVDAQMLEASHIYEDHLYAEGQSSPLNVTAEPAIYDPERKPENGSQVLNHYFDQLLQSRPEVFAFGEDVGHIGDVNQGFAGLQEKHGIDRVFDTGIREWTIMGQALGMAMRGLRPIAEIQYLDYLIYGLEPLSDDLATLRWRTNGIQAAPAIIRTRGHRLEGIWHSGSPMGMMLHSLRGMWICVPRNMTQAAGMYNTLLKGQDPAIVVECLNGYRLKERVPENLSTFCVPLGQPEILRSGEHITLVTYGSLVRIAEEACQLLAEQGIEVELIDVQTLLPFDRFEVIGASVQKTNRLLVVDEDVPGGASAFILREILETQGAYRWLDASPATLTAKANRPPFGSDGDYFCKPGMEDIVLKVHAIIAE